MQDSLNSQDIVKSSFFDDVKDNSIPGNENIQKPEIWQILSQFKQSEISRFSNILLNEGLLLARSKKSNNMKKKYFVLYEDRLVRFKTPKKEKIKKIMFLQNIKLEVFDQLGEEGEEEKKCEESSNLEKQCFFFSRNKKYDILFSTSQEDYHIWLEHFRKCCVMTYYGKYYTNLKVIGKGTFAKVILAKRLSDGKEFAVKTFEKKSILSSKSANRTKVGLINEINIMRSLDHPNIIKLYEVYEGEYHVYLVLELLKGGELFDRIIKKGHYSEKDAAIMIRKLLWALDHMHNRGFMHRDIKPENLILKDDNEFEIKLADFGLAESFDKQDLLFKRCGTPGYVAPEVLEDKKYDTKVDVFSAGVILYILLTGCSPFYGKSYNEILTKNKNGTVNFNFEEIKIKLSNEAIDLLKKMLEKDPKIRFTAKEALSHDWITKYMTDKEKDEIIESLNPAQENMRKFQENRIPVKSNKVDQSLIVNSPLITGRTDAIKQVADSPMGSPLVSRGHDSKNIHKEVLMKNMKDDPKFKKFLPNKSPPKPEDDDVSDERSPVENNIRNLKKDEKPVKPMDLHNKNSSGQNSPYVCSPLGKKARGSMGSPVKMENNLDNKGGDVKNVLKKLE